MSVLDSYMKDLAELVNKDRGTANIAGVTEAAKIMKGHLESIGFKADLVDLGPNAGNGLFATNKPNADHYDVLFNAHLDTVFPDGTAAARPLTVKGDRAYGPGCSDCKSGVLAIYYALKAARPEDLERLSIAVALNPDEETGSKASSAWLKGIAAKSSRALVFEAARAGGQLVRSRKGSTNYIVTFHGKASHAGNAPYKGANANIAAMRFALAAAGLADVDKGTTVNPGVIEGGSAPNVISEKCVVKLDTRYWNNEDDKYLDDGINKLAAAVWAPGVTQTIERVSHSNAMPLSDATKELVAQITEAAKLEGFDIDWVDAGGASDGNHMAEAGLPVIDGCGPAGGEFHCDREFLRLDTVEERIRMITRFLSLIYFSRNRSKRKRPSGRLSFLRTRIRRR